MVAISQQEIDELKDPYSVEKAMRTPNSVGEFLHLFEDETALQKEAVFNWLEGDPFPVPAAHIQWCHSQAMKEGYVENGVGGFFITEAGKKARSDAAPFGVQIG